MDARLTDEQRLLQQVAGEIAADASAGWTALAGAGFVGLHVQAGPGGAVAAALVAERFAAALTPMPYVGAGVWTPALLAAAGAGEAQAAVEEGRLRFAPVLRPDLSAPARDGEEGVAFDAEGADAGLVIASDGRLRAVALGEPARGADLTRTLRRVPADAPEQRFPLGRPLTARDRIRTEAVVLAVLAADLLGTAQRALDDAVAHIRERRQFGVPVGSFQAVQHLASHAAVLVEGARSAMRHAAWAATELPEDEALLAARQAKAACSTAARDVAETAVQLFGGIALTWEHPTHLRLRRILLSRAVLGDESAQYRAIADRRLAPAGGD
ncbi:acyl-CoA dehydrogenase family protein [Actinocorallia populi]|uniref:acyl-CoA dehydrogenase family protein n=1 Tax=Actinocorallia populi TaxID=2079200 RepID=UPI000D08742D|nr:acyl-CoA dehydrogenase family protein [Actinocorallia populi]